MSFRINFLLLLLPFCISGQVCQKNRKVIPFIVPLSTQNEECHGIILSRSYILTNAKCVNGSNNVNIHLTNRKSTLDESSSDVLTTREIISHENFRKVMSTYYQNDLALVKLPSPLNFSLSLRPAVFLLNGDDTEGFVDKAAQAVVWKAGYLTISKGVIQSANSCINTFGQDFNPTYHFCIMFSDDIFSTHIDGTINHPVLVNNNIAGFAIPYPVYDETGRIYRVTKISPVIKWVTRYTTIINKDNEIGDYLYDDIENCLVQNIQGENSLPTFKSIIQQLVEKHMETDVNNLVTLKIEEHTTTLQSLKSFYINNLHNATLEIKDETEKRFVAIQKQVNDKGREIRESINNSYAMIQQMLSVKEEDIIKRIVKKFAEFEAILDEKGRQISSVLERLSKLEETMDSQN